MSQSSLWITVSPALRRFHRPLLTYLSRKLIIREWEYQQQPDEPATLEVPLTLLHDYLKSQSRPVHLLGHSTGGIVALLYAYRYPERVQSLTLLGVGVYPLMDWHAHYYAHRQLLPCSQEIILGQMVKSLFGHQDQIRTKGLAKLLARDLEATPSPHSLLEQHSIESKKVDSPLLVCGSEHDTIVDPCSLGGWKRHFKPIDRLWKCAQGHHFFHYSNCQNVGDAILNFYDELEPLIQVKPDIRSSLI